MEIIDPIADKCTQLSIIFCLTTRYEIMKYFIFIFILKEIIIGLGALKVYRTKHKIMSARLHGKINTVILYFTMIILIAFPNIKIMTVNFLVGICICSMIWSCILYLKYDQNEIKNE